MPLRTLVRTATPIVAVLALAVAGPALALAREGPGGGGGGSSSGSGSSGSSGGSGSGSGSSGSGGSGSGSGADRPEVRVAGACVKGATSRLKVTSRDGGLETGFAVHGRTGTWRVTIVHEREVAWRGTRRMTGASHSFGVHYRLPDYSGADVVAARAVGPRGGVCFASATLPG